MRPRKSHEGPKRIAETEIESLLSESLNSADAEIAVDKNFWEELRAEAAALSKQAQSTDSMQKG